MDQAVIAAGPEHAGLFGRFAERKDSVVDLSSGIVLGKRTARRTLFRFIVTGQIGANDLPAMSAVSRAEQMVAADVEHIWVVWRKFDREGPLEAVLQSIGTLRHADHFRPDGDVVIGVIRLIVPPQQSVTKAAADRAAIDNVGIVRPHVDVAALATTGNPPLRRPDRAVKGHAGHGERGVILLRTVDSIRYSRVGGHMIELRRRLVEEGAPGEATIEADAGTAVIALDQAV